eukprot:GILK01008382.1.p1 GENE.GILK01008382.1~~GILK01008382.1.p1  ORF type:complete len:332 (-),score=50.91 GILK01008382.1:206-1165(-)
MDSFALAEVLHGLPSVPDDKVIQVAEFIGRHLDDPHLEVEAKLGRFVYRQGGKLQLPAHSECVLVSQDSGDYRFESNVPMEYFRKLNEMLNGFVTKGKLKYKKTEEVDYFHGQKVRVTRDHSKQVKAAVQKQRLGDINIWSAGHDLLDFRISASSEQPVSEIPAGNPTHSRIKERRSYQSDHWTIDITKVTAAQHEQSEVTYEIELELLHIDRLRDQYERLQSKIDQEFLYTIKGFLDNMRILAGYRPPSYLSRSAHAHQTPAPQKAGRPVSSAPVDVPMDPALKSAYHMVIGEVEPIIGGYLYHVAAQRIANPPTQPS